MTNLRKKKTVDFSKYVNVETGETLDSQFEGDITSINITNHDMVKMKSESFFIIDDKALRYLEGVLSRTEMSYIYSMCSMVRGNFNILHDKFIRPHTKTTLMEELELARNTFSRLMDKLVKQGVIYYISGYKNRRKIKHIMLNPNLARRTNVINSGCYNSFQRF